MLYNFISSKKLKIMKQLFIITIISLPLALYSCGGNNAAKESHTNHAAVSSDASTSSSTSDAGFSYKIDGKVFSGNRTDNYFNCTVKHPDNVVHFILTDLDPSVKKVQPQFSFSVADNRTTVIRKDDMDRLSSGNNVKYFASFSIPGGGTGEVPLYEFNDASTVTVTITSNTSSRLKGTFSGNLLNPDTQKVVQLTDGSFDLPFAPTSK
jgi:hypothetical protein